MILHDNNLLRGSEEDILQRVLEEYVVGTSYVGSIWRGAMRR